MREGVRNFSIGAVSIVGLTGLAFLLFRFGEFTSMFGKRYGVDIALNAAGGLREGSLVTLHGVPVGLVDSVRIETADPLHPVRVHTLIDAGVRIPEPTAPWVDASLLGSGAKLELAGLGPDSGRTYPSEQVPLLVGSFKPIDQKVFDAVDERLNSIRDSLASFNEFAKVYTELGRNLNDLTQPIAADGSNREANIRTTVERANKALTTADEAIALARSWLSDDALRADVKGAVTNARDMFARATDTVNVIGGLASNLDADRAALMKRLLVTMDQASAALGDVRNLLQLASSGDGSIGKLLKDPQLYENLADSAQRLSKAMEAIQAVAERLKAEGIILKF